MRVVHWDMTNSSHHGRCPRGLTERTDIGTHICVATYPGNPEYAISLPSHDGIQYSMACGMVRARYVSPAPRVTTQRMDGVNIVTAQHIDGVSLWHGGTDHIWTYIVSPCVNIPSWIGKDHFCQENLAPREDHDYHRDHGYFYNHWFHTTANHSHRGGGAVYWNATNPLGWFYKQLSLAITDKTEIRIYRYQDNCDDDVGIEAIELYVR